MNTRKFVNVVLVAACSIALAGCDTGATPESQSSSGSTNTPSVSGEKTSPTPEKDVPKYEAATSSSPAKNVPIPKISTQANENSKDGAAQYLRYYLDVMNYSLETYDSALLEKNSSKNCEVCYKNIILGVKYNESHGGWQVGGDYDYKVYSSKHSGNEAIVRFSMHRNESVLYKQNGEVASEKPEQSGSTDAVAILKYTNRWIVDSISINE